MPALTPRATAAAMIEAILAGQDPAPMLAAMLDPAREALARIALRRLQQHARIAAGTAGYLGRLPEPLRRQVARYLTLTRRTAR